MKKWWLVLVCLLVLIAQILGYRILRNFPEIVERYYSTGIFPYISKAMRFGLGRIPFSFGDFVYILLIVLAVRWLILHFKEIVTLSQKRLFQIFLAANIALVFFHLAWGFNYYRQPLNEILELDAELAEN